MPDLLAVCEITREAARDLAASLPPGFDVLVSPEDDGFQVAVFYRSGMGFTPELRIMPAEKEDVPKGTRPMIPVHLTFKGHVVHFVACHWTAMDKSQVARERLADVLKRNIYDFLEPEVPKPGICRHVVVIGDLNEEPMSPVFGEDRLIGRGDRDSTHSRHPRDLQAKRVRLYNAAWRYLGEQIAHGARETPTNGPSGTFFKPPHEWRTFDHILVSRGLLGASPPYLDESRTGIVLTPIMQDERGLPRPFEPGSTRGVSDHLPLVGRLILPKDLR